MKLFRATSRAALLAAIAATAGWKPVMALDLATVLSEVAQANPTIAARRSTAEAARRRIGPAGAWSNPMLEIGVENVPTNGRFDMDPMTMKVVGFAQRLPVFGPNGLERRSAEQEFSADSAALQMTAFELMGAAWQAYGDTYFAAELRRHAELHRAMMDRMVSTVRSRYESGRGRLEDVLRVEAERARVLSDVAMFGAEERAARARLDALRGREAAAPADTLVQPPMPELPVDADAWKAAVDERHPRLRELDARTEGYRLMARASRRMAWPDLQVRGSYGFREALDHGGGHYTPQDDMFSASVEFMLPLFSRQGESSEGAAMEAMARASESERRAAELALQEQVTGLEAEAIASQRSARLLADTVLVMHRQALDASWSAYTAGQSDLWPVFDSAHALYREELATARAQQQLAAAQARLVAATGRGDLVGVTLPVVGAQP